jgi:hypothetical protein
LKPQHHKHYNHSHYCDDHDEDALRCPYGTPPLLYPGRSNKFSSGKKITKKQQQQCRFSRSHVVDPDFTTKCRFQRASSSNMQQEWHLEAPTDNDNEGISVHGVCPCCCYYGVIIFISATTATLDRGCLGSSRHYSWRLVE